MHVSIPEPQAEQQIKHGGAWFSDAFFKGMFT
jgi:hypothetical protein